MNSSTRWNILHSLTKSVPCTLFTVTFFGGLCGWDSLLHAQPTAHCPGSHDGDGDGISDQRERLTGTDPLSRDTDEDGVPDGIEDQDQDGVIDKGESDPRAPGLFPGTHPYMPEPMVFDLVRALGSKQGELEVNSLFVFHRQGGNEELAWAPEIEWAFADGLAVELELPMVERQLEALKLALQWTAPSPYRHFTHGTQWIGEYSFDGRRLENTLLYLTGVRLDDWTLFTMAGLRSHDPYDRINRYSVLVNPGIFVDLEEWLTVGLETNVALRFEGAHQVRVVPQIHWQLHRRVRIQFGGGILIEDDIGPLIATRVVIE